MTVEQHSATRGPEPTPADGIERWDAQVALYLETGTFCQTDGCCHYRTPGQKAPGVNRTRCPVHSDQETKAVPDDAA